MRTAMLALTRQGARLCLALFEKFLTAGEGEKDEVSLFLPEKFAGELLPEIAARPPLSNIAVSCLKQTSGLTCSLTPGLGAGRFVFAPGDPEGRHSVYPGRVYFFDGPFRELVAALFPEFAGFVFIMAAGIVVRVIAPLLRDKRTDPAVVVMDEKGRFAVSLASGHLGGANELARKVAALGGAQAVITTATDLQQTLAVDLLAKERGMVCEPFANVKKINAALANGEKVVIFAERALPGVKPAGNVALFPLERAGAFFSACRPGGGVGAGRSPENLSFLQEPRERPAAVVLITNKILDVSPLGDLPYVFLRPKNLVAGVGCKKGVKPEEVTEALYFALAGARLAPASVRALASISLKQNEPGLLEAARRLGVEVKFFDVAEIENCAGRFRESVYVKKITGVGAVCEPAAWLAAGKPARLVVTKTVYNRVTVAVAAEN
ncbi:MAG: cobalt-precorrin 5A hydrolase [Bacillota bacterium]